MNSIRVVKVAPKLPPEVVLVENQLDALQALVGGNIEAVPLEGGLTLVCNEEGKLLDLPANTIIPEIGDWVAGTFFVTKTTDDGEFASLTDGQVKRVVARFR